MEEDTLIQNPDRVEQDWLYQSNTDMYFWGVMLCLFMALTILYQGIGFLIWAAVFFPLYNQGLNGRGYYAIGVAFRSLWNDKVNRNVVWEAQPRRHRLARILRPPAPNRHLAINVVSGLALLYNKKAKTDTLYIGGMGSDFAAQSLAIQQLLTTRIGEGFKRIASVRDYEVMVTLINSRRPSNVREALGVFAENLHPAFLPTGEEGNLQPPKDGLTEWERAELEGDKNIAAVMEDLLYMARDESRKNPMVVAITMRRDDILHKVSKKGDHSMASLEDERLIVREVARIAEDVLANCGVVDAHAYSWEEVHEHLRYLWDVHQDDVYAKAQAEASGDPDDPEYRYFVKFFHWPQKFIKAFKNFCDMDGSQHVVLRIVEAPKLVDTQTLLPLWAIDVPNVTVSLVGKTVKSQREVFVYDRLRPGTEVVRDALGITYETQQAQDRASRMTSRLETAYQSRYTQQYNIVVTVSATNKQDREDYAAEALRTIHSIDGMRAVRVNKSFLQVPWVFAAHGVPV